MNNQKYFFIRLYIAEAKAGVISPAATILPQLQDIFVEKSKYNILFKHASFNSVLSDEFYGLMYDQRHHETDIQIESVTDPDSFAFNEDDLNRSMFAVFAYPIEDSEYTKLNLLMRKAVKEKNFRYGVLKLLNAGVNKIIDFKNKLFNKESKEIDFIDKKRTFVCSSFVAYFLKNVSNRFNKYLNKQNMSIYRFNPNTLSNIPGLIRLFEGTYIEYNKKLDEFCRKNPEFKQFNRRLTYPEHVAYVNMYKTGVGLENKQTNISEINKGLEKMSPTIIFKDKKNKDLNVIDLSKPAIMSIEEFTPMLKSMLQVDEQNRIITSPLMQLDAISRNNALYVGEDVYKSLIEAPWIEEQRRAGKWMGEFEHPDKDCSIARFIKVDNDRTCHRIIKWWRDKDFIMGVCDFRVMPLGPRAWNWIETGSNPSFSVRIYTKNYVEKTSPEGKKYIVKLGKMYPITFDFVTIPGFYTAYGADADKYDIAKALGVESQRKLVSTETFEYWTHGFTKDNFKELVLAQESAPMLQEAYNIDLKNADIVYTTEGLVMIKPQEKGFENSKILFNASTFELNKILLGKEQKSNANKRLKTMYFESLDKKNKDPKIDAKEDKKKTEKMSAEDFIKLEKKISRESFENSYLNYLEDQLMYAKDAFKYSIKKGFEDVFTSTHLKKINRNLVSKGKNIMNMEDAVNSVISTMYDTLDLKSINSVLSTEDDKYIDLISIDGNTRDFGSIWFRRGLKDAIMNTKDMLNKRYGNECMIDIFKDGDFSINANEPVLSIKAKINLRIG